MHNLTYEEAIEMALDKPLWRLLAASGATHWWCMPNNDDDDDSQVVTPGPGTSALTTTPNCQTARDWQMLVIL